MEEQTAPKNDDIQEEYQESVNNRNADAQSAYFEQFEFVLSVLKDAVTNANIKDISEYKGEPLNNRYYVFSLMTERDVILKLLVQGLFGTISADVSLINTASWIIEEVEKVLTEPDATRILDFTDEERPEVLRENAQMILTGYVHQIPIVAFQIFNQSLNDAFQSHIKTHVEPLLKEHWKSLGLPPKFTISPSNTYLDYQKSVDEQFNALRKGLLGNKRAWLTTEKRANLDDEHEELRSQYQIAKDYYKESLRAFLAGKRNRTEDDWVEEWEAQSFRMFPALHYRSLIEIKNYQPYELDYIHLANSYGYSAEYIRKLVTQASSLKTPKF